MSEEIAQAVETPEASLEQQIETLSKEISEDSASLETTEATEIPAIEAKAEAEEVAEVDGGSEFVETDNEKVQARINQLVWEKNEAKRNEQAANEARDRLLAQAPQEVQAPTGEPKLEDFSEEAFEYDETKRLAAYFAAKSQYDVNTALQSQAHQFSQQEELRKVQAVQVKFQSEESAYAQQNADYNENIKKLPFFSQEVLSELKGMGPKAVHILSKRLDLAQELSEGSPMQAGRILQTLSGQLNKPKPTKASSLAPKPIETVGGSPGSLSKPIDEMTMAEIMAIS